MFVIMIVSGGFVCSASYLMCAPTQVEMLQLSNLLNVRPRCVLRGAIVGALGGLIFGGALMLAIGYSQGGMNLDSYNWAANQAFQVRLVTREVTYQDQRYQRAKDDQKLKEAGIPKDSGETYQTFGFEVLKGPAVAVGGSFVATILLFVAKTLWVGFPLHPVGYILANTYFINMVWGSLFAALVIKFIALRAGGVMFVRKVMMPFFVGVFLGTVTSYLFWDLVALILNAFGYMDAFHVNHVI
jgi:hypothetical protein